VLVKSSKSTTVAAVLEQFVTAGWFCRRLPVVDVEGSYVSSAVSNHRICELSPVN